MKNQVAFYDSNLTDNPFLDDRLRKVIQFASKLSATSVLDIGCGRGTLIQALRAASPSSKYVGIEISDSLRALANSKGIEVVKHDVSRRLPFEDETYDLVLFGEVIEHLFDPDFALDEIHRILKPAGTLIVTTPNLASWLNRLVLLCGIQPIFTETSTRKKYGRRFAKLGQGSTVIQGHIRVMTTWALLELLMDRNYSVSRVMGCKFCDLERNRLTSAIDGLFCRKPSLASGVIVVAQKQ